MVVLLVVIIEIHLPQRAQRTSNSKTSGKNRINSQNRNI
jgi:hypothetical protein